MIQVGQRLAEARFKKGLNLEDVSQGTKIKTEFLAAIEEGDFEKLPSFVYAQGFVRNYAKFVGLPEKETLALFRREFDSEKTFRVLPQGFAEKNYATSSLRKKQSLIFIIIIFLVVFGFIGYQYRSAFLNPPLYLLSPSNNMVISGTKVTVLGRTDPDATVAVNNNPVAVDESGNFRKNLIVFPGKTEITVRSINKFGRVTVVEREIEAK